MLQLSKSKLLEQNLNANKFRLVTLGNFNVPTGNEAKYLYRRTAVSRKEEG
jgi:hypothetical protein